MDSQTATARVAAAVRDTLASTGVSQVELSEATGIPRATLIRRLNGHASFTIEELTAIANHLGTTASDLLAAGVAA